MLVATMIFAALVALWGSPAVHAVVREWGERLGDGAPDEADGAPSSGAHPVARESRAARPPAAA